MSLEAAENENVVLQIHSHCGRNLVVFKPVIDSFRECVIGLINQWFGVVVRQVLGFVLSFAVYIRRLIKGIGDTMPCLIRDFITDRLVGQVIIQVADGNPPASPPLMQLLLVIYPRERNKQTHAV